MATSLPHTADYELIRRFFDFELNDEELASVEQRMETDAAFLERMRIYEQTASELEGQLVAAMPKPQIAKTVQLAPRQQTPTRFNYVRALAAGLAVVIAAAFGIWLFTQNVSDPKTLAQNYWTQSESITFSNLRTTTTDNSITMLASASDLFQEKQYASALAQLVEVKVDDANYHKAQLLSGQILFEQDEFQQAIQSFQNVVDHPNNEHNDYAYWYQALAYLKLGNKDAAIRNLKYIEEQQYAIKSAAKLLEDLYR